MSHSWIFWSSVGSLASRSIPKQIQQTERAMTSVATLRLFMSLQYPATPPSSSSPPRVASSTGPRSPAACLPPGGTKARPRHLHARDRRARAGDEARDLGDQSFPPEGNDRANEGCPNDCFSPYCSASCTLDGCGTASI